MNEALREASSPGGDRAVRIGSVAVVVMAVLAIVYTLHVASVVLIPFAVAMLLHLLFSPLVRRLRKIGVPSVISSAAILVALLVGLLLAGNSLIEPAREWLKDAPTSLRQLAREFDDIKRPFQEVKQLGEEMGQITGVALHLMGVPNPELWGAMVALFNYAPYAGAIVSTVVLTVVGVTTGETMAEALMVPGVFVVFTALEGAVITPWCLAGA